MNRAVIRYGIQSAKRWFMSGSLRSLLKNCASNDFTATAEPVLLSDVRTFREINQKIMLNFAFHEARLSMQGKKTELERVKECVDFCRDLDARLVECLIERRGVVQDTYFRRAMTVLEGLNSEFGFPPVSRPPTRPARVRVLGINDDLKTALIP